MRTHALLLSLAALTLFGQAKDQPTKPKVAFTTNLGSFVVELEPDAAPETVKNFIGYVNLGHYKGTTFHRVIDNFMVQGGGYTETGELKPPKKPIVNEAAQAQEKGLRNVRGSIAMARTSVPDSATSQFFINVVDNDRLDYPSPDGYGYCVFGHVVSGMETIDAIRVVETGPNDQPVTPVVISNASIAGPRPAPTPKKQAPKKPAQKK